MSSTTEPSPRRNASDICNPFFARFYNCVLQRGSGRKDVGCRRELRAELSGTVIEVGPGNGPNFDLYPPTVERVIAVEPEPFLWEKAIQAASRASVPIEVVAGDAERLPVEDRSVDAVVLALVLCSVPDQARVLAEAKRVLRQGGELRGVRARRGRASRPSRAAGGRSGDLLAPSIWQLPSRARHSRRA